MLNLLPLHLRLYCIEAHATGILMQTSDILRAWGKILQGKRPTLSIEITRECPLRCPGCYAYDAAHLGNGTLLRSLSDFRGQELVDKVLALVDRLKPLHLSIVGGDPLVRHRELDTLIPALLARKIHVQIVTSAFRPINPSWANLPNLTVVVSIDGLQPEHDVRRTPATYERILKSIAGQRVVVHCTITSAMTKRPGYLKEFLEYWTPRPEIAKVWFSLFTPQIGDYPEERLQPHARSAVVSELKELRNEFPKLDMAKSLIEQFDNPPENPDDCIFAQTTQTISADLTTNVGPCQFGGNPDCQACGCIASMGLAAIGGQKLGGIVPVGALFKASLAIGRAMRGSTVAGGEPPAGPPPPVSELKILSQGPRRSGD